MPPSVLRLMRPGLYSSDDLRLSSSLQNHRTANWASLGDMRAPGIHGGAVASHRVRLKSYEFWGMFHTLFLDQERIKPIFDRHQFFIRLCARF